MTGAISFLQLRAAAREIFAEALTAVDAREAVRHTVQIGGATFRIGELDLSTRARGNVYAIAIGKAAVAMASGLDQVLDDKIQAGVIAGSATEISNWRPNSPARWDSYAGGHPAPNEQSLAAAQACFDLLDRANQERALVIFLISGGGSAMLEWPLLDATSVADLESANRVLVSSGASIGEINAVRRAFSAVKGGRLSAFAPNCDQITLIVSDVPDGEAETVASGPTLPPPANAPDAKDVVSRYDLRAQLTATILCAIDAETQHSRPLSAESGGSALREYCVLLENRNALAAAAQAASRRAFNADVAYEISDQPIEAGCAELLSRFKSIREQCELLRSNACLISGGEFACPVKGDGMGGRSLETALRLAIEYDKQDAGSNETEGKPFVALCAGTDGVDGNSPAAGAIVDQTTIARARAIGLDPEDFLRRSDAYSFFVALGDVVATGPTGTNVRDIRILLA